MSQEKEATGSGRKERTRLRPSEKYEIFAYVLSGQATQREAAERFKVDRSTVVHVRERRVGGSGRSRGRDRPAAGHDPRAGRRAAPASGKKVYPFEGLSI